MLRSRAAPWWAPLALSGAVLAAFLAAAAVGAAAAGRDQRVLAGLDPLLAAVRMYGKPSVLWLVAHAVAVGCVTVGMAALLASAGLRAGRRHGAPLVLLSAAIVLATWGQISLLRGWLAVGPWLYGAGVACAVGLGWWYPLSRLGGFPDLLSEVPPAAAPVAPAWAPSSPREYLLLLLLAVSGLLLRLYALTELPQTFDVELVSSMVASHSFSGIAWWVRDSFLRENSGVAHLLPNPVLFHLFGASIYTQRLSAVLFGSAAILLFYWLARRLAGVAPALVATMLFVVAPEQLYWSRTEDTFLVAAVVLALLVVHVSMWMWRRFSLSALLTTAFCMPLCRYFYSPAMGMAVYPVLLWSYAAIGARAARRRVWRAAPFLVLGALLWVLSVSLLVHVVSPGRFRFIRPDIVYGGELWQKQGEFRDTGFGDLIRLQAQSLVDNVGTVLTGMTLRGRTDYFYDRFDAASWPTSVLPGLAVLAALGLGYLLGQPRDPRAFVLLAWVALGVLPGVLSKFPLNRRLVLLFPALHLIAGMWVVVVARLVRQTAGGAAARATRGVLAVTVAALVWSSVVAHLLLPIEPPVISGLVRFATPLFEQSDAIFHNLHPKVLLTTQLGHLDQFLARDGLPCIQSVPAQSWLRKALRPDCEFAGPTYDATIGRARAAAAGPAFNPQRIDLLLLDEPPNRAALAAIGELYPSAPLRRYRDAHGVYPLVDVTLSTSDMRALRAPALHAASAEQAAALRTRLLAQVALWPDPTGAQSVAGDGVAVHGGLLVEREGWYRFAIDPPCAASTLSIDGTRTLPEVASAMTAGVHAFDLRLASVATCQLPLRLTMQAQEWRVAQVVPFEFLVAPRVASLPHARAAPVASSRGYGSASVFVTDRVRDFFVDAQGRVTVLRRDPVRVERFTADGQLETAWQPQLRPDARVRSIAGAADGTTALLGDGVVLLFDGAGKQVDAWTKPWVWPGEATFWTPERLLVAMGAVGSVDIVDRQGRLIRRWKTFDGGPGTFEHPVALGASRAGDVAVIESDGQALLFRGEGGETPRWVRSFRIGFQELPARPRGVAFDDAGHLIVPNPGGTAPLVYTLDGARVMATEASRDISRKGLGESARAAGDAERFYVLDTHGQLLRLGP